MAVVCQSSYSYTLTFLCPHKPSAPQLLKWALINCWMSPSQWRTPGRTPTTAVSLWHTHMDSPIGSLQLCRYGVMIYSVSINLRSAVVCVLSFLFSLKSLFNKGKNRVRLPGQWRWLFARKDRLHCWQAHFQKQLKGLFFVQEDLLSVLQKEEVIWSIVSLQAIFIISYGIETNSQLDQRISVTANANRYCSVCRTICKYVQYLCNGALTITTNMFTSLLVGIWSTPAQANSTKCKRLTWSTAFLLQCKGLCCSMWSERHDLENDNYFELTYHYAIVTV